MKQPWNERRRPLSHDCTAHNPGAGTPVGRAEANATGAYVTATRGDADVALGVTESRRRSPPPPLPSPRAGGADRQDASVWVEAQAQPVVDTSCDPALVPVERNVTEVVSARGRGAWIGWSTAMVLLAASGAHYLFEYKPLQVHLERAEQALARQRNVQGTQVAALEAELQRTRAQLERAAAAQAASSAQAAPEPVVEEPVTDRERRAKPGREHSASGALLAAQRARRIGLTPASLAQRSAPPSRTEMLPPTRSLSPVVPARPKGSKA